MIHTKARANPENTNKDPGTFFSQIGTTDPWSCKTTDPIIIKITAVMVNINNTLVDSIFKRFNGYVKINLYNTRMAGRRRIITRLMRE